MLFILGGSAPTIGAYFAVVKTGEAGSLQEFHARVLKFKTGPLLYLFALLVPVLLWVATTFSASMVTAISHFTMSPQPFFVYIPAFFTSIIFGGIEEFGWRGILQHELSRRLNLFVTNLVIGLIWALWHLPLFYIVGTSHQGNSFLFYTLGAIGFSSFMTWLYARSASVFLCVLFHASINAAAITGLAVSMDLPVAYPIAATVIFVTGLIFITLAGIKPESLKPYCH